MDYSGSTVPVIDAETGEVRQAQLFVAVLGASNYTFAEATWTQSLPDWLGSHSRALTFFGGCPALIIPDNLRSGVSAACRYDPDLNPSYQQWAEHYQVAVLPARPYRPRDKAKAEVAVLVVQRWIPGPTAPPPLLLPGRGEPVYRRVCLKTLTTAPSRQLPGSRRSCLRGA